MILLNSMLFGITFAVALVFVVIPSAIILPTISVTVTIPISTPITISSTVPVPIATGVVVIPISMITGTGDYNSQSVFLALGEDGFL